MKCEYFCKKKSFDPRKIEEAQVFFSNGDFVTLSKGEIVDLSIKFYDELRVGEEGFCPVAKSGFVKCKISRKNRRNGDSLLYDNSEYGKNFKEYFENRCVNENGIRYMRIFDENFWHLPFYCFATGRMQDGFLILDIQESYGCGSADSDFHTVRARGITKENVEKILLGFENCDGFEVFPEEIKDMQLDFEKDLEWGSAAFQRKLSSGYIRLKLNKDITWRVSHMQFDGGRNIIPKLEKRLCGKGKDTIDICHLYVTYDYAGYGMALKECVGIDDIRPIEEQENDEWGYVSGYAERQNDGSVLIVFGK